MFFSSSFRLCREKYISIILKMEEMLKSWFPNVKLQDQVVVTQTEDAAPTKKLKVRFREQLACVRTADRRGLLSRTYGVVAVQEGAKHLLLFNHKSGTRKGGLNAIFAAVLPRSLIHCEQWRGRKVDLEGCPKGIRKVKILWNIPLHLI